MAIPQTYEYDMERALRLSRQRAALSGTTLASPETSRIISGTMAPHIQQYAQRVGRAQDREMRQRRWQQSHKLQKKRVKYEQDAAEMAGYAQFAQLGLYGAHVYQQNQPQIQNTMSEFDQWWNQWTLNRQQPVYGYYD
jgi:hypothetical protein